MPVERVLKRIELFGRRNILLRSDNSGRLDAVTWALALIPLVIPPVLALVLAWRRRGLAAEPSYDPTWVSIVASANLLLSIGLAVRFGGDAIALASWIRDWMTPPLVKTPVSGPKLTPV